MSLNLFEKILDKLSLIHFEELHINGGEPTVHSDFENISKLARQKISTRTLKLGTNIIVPSNNSRIMELIIRYYDEILIGCDNEHQNYKNLVRALPILRSNGLTVIVNSVIESTDSVILKNIEDLCDEYGAIFVKNHIHHIDVGQPKNNLQGLCMRYWNLHLMIQEDGSCYRCFNAMAKKDSEFNIFDDDFESKLFLARTEHYNFCLKCHEYQDSSQITPSLI